MTDWEFAFPRSPGEPGLTKREYFAAAALAGSIAADTVATKHAEWCVAVADALIAELGK